MLKRSLTELATGAVFASEGLSQRLRAYLLQRVPPDDAKSLPAACRDALAADLDRLHPHRFRLNDLRRAFGIWWPDSLFLNGKWALFDELFDQLMLRNGDFIQYRDDKVQAYARLAADVEPTLLVGWHIAGWAINEELSPHDVARVVDSQLPFFAPPPRPNRPYAEGHVHLGGIHFDALALLGNLGEDLSPETAADFAPLRELITVLLDAKLQKGESDRIEKENGFRERCIRALTGNELDDKVDQIDWRLQFERHRLADKVGSEWLKAQLANAMLAGDQSRAWRWLSVFLWYSCRHPATSEYVRVAIFYLLGRLMQFRRKMIMDGQGLTRFTDYYYGNKLRNAVDIPASTQDVVARMFVGKRDLAEIKIAPDKATVGLISRFAKAVARNSGIVAPDYGSELPAVAIRSYVEQLERWHFCVHFLRRDYYAKSRRLLWEDAEKFFRALSNEAGWNLDEFLGGHLNPNYRFYPARWLRGLDVAGDENAVRSEVFAPVLRWLRRGLLPRPPGEHGSAGFHLSVHAGEDYAHPLSGMRHVDETVRFCEMRNGDRIGHGLALGIDPLKWVERHGGMILPVDEHVDNLVWAWHHAGLMSARLPLAAQIIPRLERRIAQFWPHVSWNREHLDATPQSLHTAWELRRNCHYQIVSDPTRIDDSKLRAAAPDYDRLTSKKPTDPDSPEHLYFRYQQKDLAPEDLAQKDLPKAPRHVLIAQPGGEPAMAYDLPAASGDALLHDFETAEDLEFMCALQDYLLNKYDAMGLIIEANPSSNVYIARLENHSEHPIFRWYPPNESCLASGAQWNRFGLRRGPIKVLVNTDDPGIMPTTLRTEFALLGEAAIDLGYSRTCVEAWLERLREFGLDEFNRNHLPVFEEGH
jgi:hypothetical protein